MGERTSGRTIAIGGVGGSGTRVYASILRGCGFYIGSDLNESLDNLWFTLLFKRRSILLEPPDAVVDLVDLFVRRMSGRDVSHHPAIERVVRLAEGSRVRHETDWLRQRLLTLLASDELRQSADILWGWKAPNTHVVIDRFLSAMPDLRYIHVVRDPFYMAFSGNQNQLAIWGGIFLDRDVEMSPRDALSYWCSVHLRMEEMQVRFPGRILFASYDRLCLFPREEIARILHFIGQAPEDDIAVELQGLVSRERRSRPKPEHLAFSFEEKLRATAEEFCNRHFPSAGTDR